MGNIIVHIGIAILKMLGYLPLWFLYLCSDFFYYIIKLMGYRNDIVFGNLKNAFPEKSKEELKVIKHKFYHHFSDLFFETVKIHGLSKKQILKRVTAENVELLNRYYDEGRDVIVAMGHYGNWEWVPVINLLIKAQGTEVYHPLKNAPYDKYMLGLRSKWGTMNFPMKTAYRDMLKLKRDNKRFVIGMIGDQSPAKNKIQYYTQFFGQETPVLLGIEKMAIKTNSPVVFLEVSKPKRGYYHLKFVSLVENPKECEPYEITNLHTQYLESVIRKQPEFWLWTHNRWKRKKQQDKPQ